MAIFHLFPKIHCCFPILVDYPVTPECTYLLIRLSSEKLCPSKQSALCLNDIIQRQDKTSHNLLAIKLAKRHQNGLERSLSLRTAANSETNQDNYIPSSLAAILMKRYWSRFYFVWVVISEEKYE